MTVNPIHRIASLALVLAACSSPAVCGGCSGDGGLPDGELPTAFRVDAEVVSVEPGPGWGESAKNLCTPTPEDVDPAGPDWQLRFDRMHDPVEPTFKEWTSSYNGDSADYCQDTAADDCCEPLRAEGGGWVLVCRGQGAPPLRGSEFEFTFGADGSGESLTTVRALSNGSVVCTARATWIVIIPAAP